MGIDRITQRMMTDRSLNGLQSGLSRVAQLQEQLSSGRRLHRPSDGPSEVAGAMRLRGSVAATQQYQRNAQDGLTWLTQADAALGSVTGQLHRARDLALQGANSGVVSATDREALAVEIEQLRGGILAQANTLHLGRPVFGGVTGGSAAYDASGQYAGQPGEVTRTVGDGVRVRVDVDGRAAFGPDGASTFDHLTALAGALRAGDPAGIRAGLDALGADLDRVTRARTEAGARVNRLESALAVGGDAEVRLSASLAEVEQADLTETVVELQMQEIAYQAALGATSRVMQQSLMDFLR